MIECTRVLVEGNTEVLLFERAFSIIENKIGLMKIIDSRNGKEKVIGHFIDSILSGPPTEKGNLCYLVDGNDEGFEEIYNKIYNKLKKELKEIKLKAEKPYIMFCGEKGCHILVVIGKKEENYRGCLETLLNEILNSKTTSEIDEIINRILSFMRKRKKFTICDEEKIKFYERVLLLSSDPSTLYIDKNFVNELLKLVNPQDIKQILGIEIKPPIQF